MLAKCFVPYPKRQKPVNFEEKQTQTFDTNTKDRNVRVNSKASEQPAYTATLIRM